MPPVHVNLIQVAESLGVEEAVVEGWVRTEGLPCVKDGGRLIFDSAQVASWATERGMAARAGFLAPESHGEVGVNLGALLRRGGIWRDVAPHDVRNVLGKVLGELPGGSPQIQTMLAQRIRLPGAITWAVVGDGVALPHLRSRVALGKDSGLVAMLLLKQPMELKDPPDEGVQIDRLLFFVAPSPRTHLELLAALSSGLAKGGLRKCMERGVPDEEIYDAFSRCQAGARRDTEARS